ncbi:Hypothetical predicted protein, partial [Olea europaea subsp. europaea]
LRQIQRETLDVSSLAELYHHGSGLKRKTITVKDLVCQRMRPCKAYPGLISSWWNAGKTEYARILRVAKLGQREVILVCKNSGSSGS